MDKKEYRRQWRLKNKEKIKKQMSQWRLKNQERLKEYSKQYNKTNKEKIDKNAKEYYQKNKERIKPIKRKYSTDNRERFREYNKTWRQNHQIYFLDKKISVDFIEKTFSCICCRFQGKTNFHHLKYDLNDPLKYTVELCDRCHILWHQEENYLRYGKKGILSSKELMIESN